MVDIKKKPRPKKLKVEKKIGLEDLKKLNAELSAVMLDHSATKAEMEQHRKYYKHSAFYAPKSGESVAKSELKSNMLRVFADKNIHYTSPLPLFKVPTTGADEMQRNAASVREKIIYGVHRASNTDFLQSLFSFDTTVQSTAVAETYFDLKKRCVKIRRYDPRYCFWQYSNDNERRVIAFWAVYPITKAESRRLYGVEPTQSLIDPLSIKSEALSRVDGQDWFLFVRRIDENNRSAWVGDKWVEKPHNHQMGCLPVDVSMPWYDGSANQRGAFYLEPLLPLQAEYNDTLRQRALIVRRMSNPVIWGRGIVNRQFDDVRQTLQQPGGGFVGLKQGGELGVLQVPDNRIVSEYQAFLLSEMMRIAGFGAAAFGESVGANTSGDALSMYFNPTQRSIDHQNLSWISFWQSINSKILKLYDTFLKTDEKVKLSGYSPHGTLLPLTEGGKEREYDSGGFDIEFDKSAIDGNYNNIAIPKSATPKDEIANKRLLLEAAKQGVISRTTAYEEWGILSPQDELALLKQEQEDPALNPQGVSSLMSASGKLDNGGIADVQQPSELS